MHLIVPFAGVLSEAGRHAASTLSLPHLERLLARWRTGTAWGSDEHSLSAPHELALADALGWPIVDGALPLAACAARRDGIDAGTRAIGLLTPVHLHLGTEQVTMTDPDALALADADARTLFDALQSLFAGADFELLWGTTQRWYLVHQCLAVLPTASLDRVIGRNIDPWLPEAPSARPWRRLQSEAQMLLHAHEVNARREAAGLSSINSLWLSGCGVAPAASTHEAPRFDDRLRQPALNEDWAAWAEAWHALDAGPIAALLHESAAATLTLAGERRALPLSAAKPSLGQRLRSVWQRPSAHQMLEQL